MELIFVSIVVSLTVAFSFATAGIAMLPSWVFYPKVIIIVVGQRYHINGQRSCLRLNMSLR